MKAISRSLKFQLLSFLKSWIIAMVAGLGVTILINFITINQHTRSLVSTSYSYMLFGILITFVSVVLLIVQCFMCFYEDYRFATRLGITKRNFLISNLMFFLIVILIFSIGISGIISSGIIYLEDIIDLTGLKIEIPKDADISEEEIYRYIEMKHEEFIKSGFLNVFPIVFSVLLSLVGFWILVGFLFFALNIKALLVIIPLVIILGKFDGFLHPNSLIPAILFFMISQGIIAFSATRVEERI